MTRHVTHIAMAGDRHVLLGMAVAGRSALEKTSRPLAFEILGTGFTADDKAKLIESWQHPMTEGVRFYDVSVSDTKSYRSTLYLKSKAAYSRYFIGRITDVDRIVYIDTDIIVMRDISEASMIDLEGKTIAAVRDISIRLEPEQPRIINILGMKQSKDYFNSGFLIVDMSKWRERGAESGLTQISKDMFDKLDCQDQDALNIFFEDDVRLLDVSWNTSQYEAVYDIDGVILHLIGTIKPWLSDYKYHFLDTFNYWLDRTAYAGVRPVDENTIFAKVNRIIRRIPTLDMLINKIRKMIL